MAAVDTAVEVFGLLGEQVGGPPGAVGAQAVQQLVLAVLQGPLEPTGQRGHDGVDQLVPPDGLGAPLFGWARPLPHRRRPRPGLIGLGGGLRRPGLRLGRLRASARPWRRLRGPPDFVARVFVVAGTGGVVTSDSGTGSGSGVGPGSTARLRAASEASAIELGPPGAWRRGRRPPRVAVPPSVAGSALLGPGSDAGATFLGLTHSALRRRATRFAGLGVQWDVDGRRSGCGRLLVGQQLGGQLLGRGGFDPVQRLTAGRLGGQSGVVLGGEQLRGDGVHRVADVLHGLGQTLPSGPELLDLGVQHLPALGQVGQHPGPEPLGLVHHGPALLAGLLQHGVGLALGLLHGGGGLVLGALPQLGGGRLDARRPARPAGLRSGSGSAGSPHGLRSAVDWPRPPTWPPSPPPPRGRCAAPGPSRCPGRQ